MGAELPFERSHDQMDADSEPDEFSQNFSETYQDQTDSDTELEGILDKSTRIPQDISGAKTKSRGSAQQATKRSLNQAEVEIEVGGSSKRPRSDKSGLRHRRHFNSSQDDNIPYRATRIIPTHEPSPSGNTILPPISKAIHPPNPSIDPRHPLDPKCLPTQWPKHSPPQTLTPSLLARNHPSEAKTKLNTALPPPSRPTFTRLAADGAQGMQVLFLVDHATKGDAVHHAISAYVAEDSSEMKQLMSKYRVGRSSYKTQFFAKARIICAQLVARYEFLELGEEEGDRERRLAYFGEKCTKARLATLYSHLASAVDIPRILAARRPHEKAFRALMTQVFVHSMEDLWWFEFQPSKQNLSATLEQQNKEAVYSRFRDLTDQINGLPAARDMPGYLEVPLKIDFPRYVLFNHDPRV